MNQLKENLIWIALGIPGMVLIGLVLHSLVHFETGVLVITSMIAEKRNSYLRVMLTAPEKKAIEQRAEALGISVSELVRRSAIYGRIESFNFDIAEVEKLHHELLKEGTNLNQLMYFVNAQGLPAYNEKAVFRTLEKVYQNARKVDRFIEELEKRYHVDYVPHDYLADEPDNRNL